MNPKAESGSNLQQNRNNYEYSKSLPDEIEFEESTKKGKTTKRPRSKKPGELSADDSYGSRASSIETAVPKYAQDARKAKGDQRNLEEATDDMKILQQKSRKAK